MSEFHNTVYALTLLSEYTHTLDSLPIDLSRNFADLRELDAVLSSSIQTITAKIYKLIALIEQDKASKEDRLWLLSDIADEAQRLKMGGEDKIRVACQGADNLKAHAGHLRALTEHIPGFDAQVLDSKTTYPHVSDRAYMPVFISDTGRRRRGGLGSIMVATNPEPSPAKRKRLAKEDEIDITGRSPRKPIADGNPKPRNNGRKKAERGVSPSDSQISVSNSLQHQVSHFSTGRSGSNGRASATANKRRAGGGNAIRGTPLANEVYTASHESHTNTQGGSRRAGQGTNSSTTGTTTTDAFNHLPPSTSHPSFHASYQNGNGNNPATGGTTQGNAAYDASGMANIAGSQDWNSIPRAQQLEGPGMPMARSSSMHSTPASVAVVNQNNGNNDTTDAGDADGDGDERTYCFCDGVSYGEMIACDDENCEREWFHLGCIALTQPPQGEWYCDACKNKKNGKRTVRGGKRRTGGNRAGGRV